MGLPVKRLILAVNENDQFPRFMSGQPYLPTRPSKACLSNSMNVGHPSNLARFFDAFKGTVDKDGNVWRLPDIDGMRQRLFTVSVTDEETKDAIRTASQRWSRILEPHGAVAWRGLEAYRQLTGDMAKAVILETAHPAKFPETVREVLGIDPSPPDSMRDLATRTGEAVELPADYAAIKEFLLKNRP
jgi:threonine synthase